MENIQQNKYLKENYEHIHLKSENNFNIIFTAKNKKTKKNVILKVYTNELIEKGPKTFLYNQIKREIELTQLCQCDNIVKLYNDKNELDKIIKKIEYEYSDINKDNRGKYNERDIDYDIDIIILEYEYCYYITLGKILKDKGKISLDDKQINDGVLVDKKKIFFLRKLPNQWQ